MKVACRAVRATNINALFGEQKASSCLVGASPLRLAEKHKAILSRLELNYRLAVLGQ